MINSRNIFNNLMARELVLNQSIARIVSKENKLLATKLMMDMNLSPQLFFQTGFQQGLQQGIDQGFQQGIERSLGVEPRAEGGPVESGKEYLVGEEGKETYVPSPSFSLSIGREDPYNLKSNVITESFFDTGKGRSSDSYEIKSSDGKVLFSDKVEMIGSAMKESSYLHHSDTETFDDGSGETFTENVNMSSRSLDIGVPDLIEHKDQLLGEIHKIEGFENVTIEDVIQGRTGLDDNTMFNILANSDASYATAAKKEAAAEMDLKARGIKPGEAYSTYGTNVTDIMSDDIMDETSKSLKGTVGYRSGQINPASLNKFYDTFKEKGKRTYTVKGYNQGGLVEAVSKPQVKSNDLTLPDDDMGVQILPPISQVVGDSGDENKSASIPFTPSSIDVEPIGETASSVTFIDVISNPYLSLA